MSTCQGPEDSRFQMLVGNILISERCGLTQTWGSLALMFNILCAKVAFSLLTGASWLYEVFIRFVIYLLIYLIISEFVYLFCPHYNTIIHIQISEEKCFKSRPSIGLFHQHFSDRQESQMLIQSSYRASTSELEEEQNSRGKWNRFTERWCSKCSKRSQEDDGKLQQENPRNGHIGYQHKTWCEGVQSGDDKLWDESLSKSDPTPVEVLPVALKNQVRYQHEMKNEKQTGDDKMRNVACSMTD